MTTVHMIFCQIHQLKLSLQFFKTLRCAEKEKPIIAPCLRILCAWFKHGLDEEKRLESSAVKTEMAGIKIDRETEMSPVDRIAAISGEGEFGVKGTKVGPVVDPETRTALVEILMMTIMALVMVAAVRAEGETAAVAVSANSAGAAVAPAMLRLTS